MNIQEAFPSNYKKAHDYPSAKVEVIDKVLIESIGRENEQKPCLYFEGSTQPLVLNRTNSNTVADLYGNDTDTWKGKPVEVFVVQVEFSGKVVDGIRLRKPSEKFVDEDLNF